jgi:hypothetical protein
MVKPRAEVVSNEVFKAMPACEQGFYVPCGCCSNYLLNGSGAQHKEFPMLHVCKECSENPDRINEDISDVVLISDTNYWAGENGVTEWTFLKGITRLQAVLFLEQDGCSPNGHGTGVDYSPSGKRFANPVTFRETTNYLMVKQTHGLDT